MSSTIPSPPREQLCNRYYGNKHTPKGQGGKASRFFFAKKKKLKFSFYYQPCLLCTLPLTLPFFSPCSLSHNLPLPRAH